MTDVKKRTAALVAEIDPAELTIRMIEAAAGVKRPPGATAAEIRERTDPVAWERYSRAAEAAARYIAECINAGKRPS